MSTSIYSPGEKKYGDSRTGGRTEDGVYVASCKEAGFQEEGRNTRKELGLKRKEGSEGRKSLLKVNLPEIGGQGGKACGLNSRSSPRGTQHAQGLRGRKNSEGSPVRSRQTPVCTCKGIKSRKRKNLRKGNSTKHHRVTIKKKKGPTAIFSKWKKGPLRKKLYQRGNRESPEGFTKGG